MTRLEKSLQTLKQHSLGELYKLQNQRHDRHCPVNTRGTITAECKCGLAERRIAAGERARRQ